MQDRFFDERGLGEFVVADAFGNSLSVSWTPIDAKDLAEPDQTTTLFNAVKIASQHMHRAGYVIA